MNESLETAKFGVPCPRCGNPSSDIACEKCGRNLPPCPHGDKIGELEDEVERLKWLEAASLESTVNWNMASQRTLHQMCEVYQCGKVELREVQAQVERLKRHVAQSWSAYDRLSVDELHALQQRNAVRDEAQGLAESVASFGLELVEAQAQLRDTQQERDDASTAADVYIRELRERDGQVAALVKAADDGDGGCLLCNALADRASEAIPHRKACPLADLPAAPQAIRAAAEREPGLREALDRASEWIAAVEVAKMPGVGDTQTEVLNIVNAALAQEEHGS